MIYLENITSAQLVNIPLLGKRPSSMDITLRSTIDNRIVSQSGIVDTGTSRLFISVAVTLPAGLDKGEYQYDITSHGETIASGLATIGDYVRERTEYQKTIQYEQF